MQEPQAETKVSSNAKTWPLALGLVVVFAGAAFFAGVHFGGGGASAGPMEAGLFSFFKSKTAPVDSVNLDEFWRVWNLMDSKFVSGSSTQTISSKEKIEGAIAGMVRSFDDPYTVFLPQVQSDQFTEEISGNFGGVGMEVGMRENVVTVIAPLPESPAEAAGIVAGDVIVAIDEQSTDGMGVDEAVKLIRGEEGTSVNLRLYREGSTEFLEKSVVRDTITIPTVKTEKRDDVFIIKLYSFNALSEAKMEGALREYIKSDTKKLILDVRGNPGGYLQSAVTITSYFLDSGKVIVRENFGEGKEEEVYRSYGRTLREFAPSKMVVLVDQGSASASEILAGALKEHGVAKVIGSQTFGKGSVQELVPLPDGSSLKVTVARWFTPNGNSISDGGLEPDIVVERTPEQFLAEEDPQLEAALEYMSE